MQIQQNGEPKAPTEPTPNPNALPEGQDQVVLVLDLRRVDPGNPDGSPSPDLASLLAGHEPEKAQALSFLADSIAEVLGFDSALSLIGVQKVVDYEPGPGLTTLDAFRDIVGGLAPTPAPEEVVTEQPIETVAGEETSEEAPAEVAEPTEPASEPVPEAIEDVPHDQEPEQADREITIEELVDAGTLELEDATAGQTPPAEAAVEDSPVGESVTTSPGPVDPPTEG